MSYVDTSWVSQLEVKPSTEEIAKLEAHVELLYEWNKIHALTAVKTREEMYQKHVVDCVSAWMLLQSDWQMHGQNTPLRQKWLDIGSGTGYPGIVWAILQPHAEVVLCECVIKKVVFLRHVVRELKLDNVSVLSGNIEAMPPQNADFAVSRAFASLAKTIALVQKHLQKAGEPKGKLVALKSQDLAAELAQLQQISTAWHVEKILPLPSKLGMTHRNIVILASNPKTF